MKRVAFNIKYLETCWCLNLYVTLKYILGPFIALLDIELGQLKAAYAKETEQRAELEEQRRVAIEATQKEKVLVEEQRAKAEIEMEY